MRSIVALLPLAASKDKYPRSRQRLRVALYRASRLTPGESPPLPAVNGMLNKVPDDFDFYVKPTEISRTIMP